MRIGIIGGGPAGMMAALTAAADPTRQILLFERQARVGRKLLSTGNGRCNLSNIHAGLSGYHGANPAFVLPALEQFSVRQTRQFFTDMGLLTVTEPSGRIYPFSDQANSVVDVLRHCLDARKTITLLTGKEITRIKAQAQGFTLKTREESWKVDKLIIAAGGAAGSKLGGGLSGYQLLRSLGHGCTKLYPSLVQIKTEDTFVKSLKGVRAQARVALRSKKRLLAQVESEVQFTEYGVSGPAGFALSRAVATGPTDMALHLDSLPQLSPEALLSALCIRLSQQPKLPQEELLTGFVHNRLGQTLLRSAGIKGKAPASQLTWPQLTSAVAAVHDFVLPVTGVMGMDCAQVTAGGICTDEFDPQTLESRLVPGLYAAGEVLDIDGDCGGYNLQWAWSSGHLAGMIRSNYVNHP